MVNLDKDIQYIKGVGPSRATLLKKLGIYNLGDLITYFPREYEDREKEKKLQQALLSIKHKFGKNAVLKGVSLEEGATAKDRNNQIGGHKA